MSDFQSKPCTAFEGQNCIASGRLADVALAVKAVMAARPDTSLLVFNDATGAVVDLDLRGTDSEIAARLDTRSETDDGRPDRGPGRPKLGVVAREVTLLPRHWDWLSLQPGGASQTLRRLVDQARRGDGGSTQAWAAQAAAYRFMSAMAGNLEGFEEAARALFAGDATRFATHTSGWPVDIQAYAERLMMGGVSPPAP